MSPMTSSLTLVATLACLLVGTWSVAAHDAPTTTRPAQAPLPPALPEPSASPHPYFPDVLLIDQDGKERRLYSDLLKGKVIVMHSLFTQCEASCPVVVATFARLQQWLGERLDKKVHLLSVSVDPETDTPARLKAYAEQFGAKPGWYFLTGKKSHIDWVLYKLGHYVETREEHRNIIIVGNEPTGLWKKVFGLAAPDEIIRLLEGVLHD
jgi:protein SCO1